MKRFKIIACFLLTFSLTFSEESSVVAEQKTRITQLEQQIETQNKIIARYERLEDKIDSRISQSLSLDKEVKEVHKENLISLKEDFQSKMNLILALIALVSILPIYDRIMSAKTFAKLKKQEKDLEEQQGRLNKQKEDFEEYIVKIRKEFDSIHATGNLKAISENLEILEGSTEHSLVYFKNIVTYYNSNFRLIMHNKDNILKNSLNGLVFGINLMLLKGVSETEIVKEIILDKQAYTYLMENKEKTLMKGYSLLEKEAVEGVIKKLSEG